MSRVHFDGEPDTCKRMRALFSKTDRRQWKYREPKWIKFVLLADAKGRSLVSQVWSKLRRVA